MRDALPDSIIELVRVLGGERIRFSSAHLPDVIDVLPKMMATRNIRLQRLGESIDFQAVSPWSSGGEVP